MKIENSLIVKSKNFDKAKKLVIFLHGYGSEGADFENGINHISKDFQDTVFLAPDGPFECEEYCGRKWFSLSNDLKQKEITDGLSQAAPLLKTYLEEIKQEYSCDNIVLVGFSQGAMLSFEMLYHARLSMIVACAGIFIAHEAKPIIDKNTNVLIVHSDDDVVVPYNNAILAKEELDKLGVTNKILTYHGIGHSISVEAWTSCAAFIRDGI